MKLLTFPLQIFLILNYVAILHGQESHLDVEGDVKILGRIDVHREGDTTTVLVGRNAGIIIDPTVRTWNTFVGSSAGKNNTEGSRNTFVGERAGRGNVIGSSNSFFGQGAGAANITGHSNSFFGQDAGRLNLFGTRNTYLGYNSGQAAVGQILDRAIAIGYEARVSCDSCAVIGGTGANAVNVGINTDTPTERLDVHGNAAFRSVGTSLFKFPLSIDNDGVLTTDASDRRLKENITDIDQSLEKVLNLRGVTYNWKTDETKEKRIGLIAQEVEEVLPEVVFTNIVDGFKGVRYQEIVALLIEAMKEQQTAFNRLNQENVELRNRLDRIEAQFASLAQVQTRE